MGKNQQFLSVAFITGQLGLGGAERQLYILIKGLLQQGLRCIVITLNPGQNDYWEEPLHELGIPLYEVPKTLPRALRFLTIRDILRRESVLIVHSWTFSANMYAAIGGRIAGTPVRLGSERANQHLTRRALGPVWYDLCLWGLNGLVTNNEPSAQYLRKYRAQLNVKVVPNGVEIPNPITPAEHKRLRTHLGVPESLPIIGAVGSLVPRKNFTALIEAAVILSKKYLSFGLMFFGDGPLRNSLENQANESLPGKYVRFMGSVPRAAEWYPVFDILCMPSMNQEGMPNVIMEASAANLAVVATAIDGAFEIIDNNRTGFLIPINDISSLASSLEKLVLDQDLRLCMGNAGREKMERQFSVAHMINRMISIYEETLS